MKFQDWYAKNELKIKEMARFTTNPIKLMEFAWDERGKIDDAIIQKMTEFIEKQTPKSTIGYEVDKLEKENCKQKPKIGDRNTCASCGTEIEYTTHGYWQHTTTKPRHIAQPINDYSLIPTISFLDEL